ncbi:MAG: transcription-repair coupling factor [Gammaproteobacteria bacterium]|nr:transcription-repair coupling factor [Gammaproteobacteria bacterium]
MQPAPLIDVPLPAAGSRLCWGELYGSALALVLVEAARRAGGPILVVTASGRAADQFLAELRFFAPPELPLLALPDHETLPYDPFSPHPDLVSERLRALAAMPELTHGIVVTTQAVLLGRLPPRRFIAAHSFDLRRGERLDLAALRARLALAGYVHVSQVRSPGELAIRGSVVDLYPAGAERPLRLDLFDDEIESIRAFDPEDQRSREFVEQLALLPAREFPTSPEAIALFRGHWRERFEGDPQQCPVYRAVSAGHAPAGIEAWLPLFFAHTDALADYLPAAALIVDTVDLERSLPLAWSEITARYDDRRHDRERPLLEPAEAFLPAAESNARLALQPRVLAMAHKVEPLASPGPYHNFGTEPPPELRVDPRAATPLAALLALLDTGRERVLLLADSPGRREVLLAQLRAAGRVPEPVTDWSGFAAATTRFALAVAADVRGLRLRQPALQLVAEDQLFGERARQERRRRRAERAPAAILGELIALAPGAPVVHEEYGVGRYRGLRVMQVEGAPAEFLVLEYAGGDLLYVPVHAVDRVARYTGGSPDTAPLHRLGTEQWARARRRAAEKLRDVAAELLDLYARRAARAGRILEFDAAAVAAFAGGFPFEETADQRDAIEAVLAELRSGRIMDRVVCGDVGFGKTEIALRAAFAAVQAGGQVAVLVPTTLLAQQHSQTFADRCADWPIRIENLSRFRSAAEQRVVLADLAAGRVDIVIGTHRLLQRDVAFRDLALVIVDEEHRFGVGHKERLRQLRADVSTLTLTATPIPRTLNLALGGLRDLSLLTTPPAGRVAIETFVCEWSDPLVREACLRELRRGGQVYFVHNTVQGIEQRAAMLRRLVPEATIRVGHGQMCERDLERLMVDFYHRRFEILVCTTIIESGIDVPTANTILIERADRLGLAQLHQLRGRVGRSHHRAFAYLIAPPRAALPADAVKRLEAIEALEELGAGFTLATHDLEIRGAGELLGEEQSGQIEEIGIGLYLELLERAVQALRAGREPELARPLHAGPEIELNLPALLPDDYVPDVPLRLQLYRRIAAAPTSAALDDLRAELIDRFGPLPPPGLALFDVHGLRLLARQLGIRRLQLGPNAGLVEFAADHQVDPARVIRLMQGDPRQYRMDGPQRLRFTLQDADGPARLARAAWLLGELGAPAAAQPSN